MQKDNEDNTSIWIKSGIPKLRKMPVRPFVDLKLWHLIDLLTVWGYI